MSLQNATLLLGATLSASGGTSKGFSLSGKRVPNGILLIDAGESNALIRRSITCKSVPAVYDKGNWTFDKREVTLTQPFVSASGVSLFPSIRIVMNFHPEMSAAAVQELAGLAGQVFSDPDFAALIATGGLG